MWRESGWQTVRSANKDPDFRNRAKVDDSQADRLIRNVDKVLLTRFAEDVDPVCRRLARRRIAHPDRSWPRLRMVLFDDDETLMSTTVTSWLRRGPTNWQQPDARLEYGIRTTSGHLRR